MKKNKFFIVAIVILLICSSVAYFGVSALANKDKDKISNGVYIDTVNVSGMTKAEATKAIQNYIADRKSKRITINVDQDTVVSSLNDLGYEVVENDVIEEAFMVGKSGNLLKRYKERKDIEEEGLVFHLEFSLDDAKVEGLVNDQCTAFEVPAKDATIKRENSEFIITDHVTGRKVVIDETVEKIKSTILTDWDGKDITMEAVVIDDVPQYTRETLEKIDSVLGSYETSYTTSSNSRANNLAVGAKFIDGTLLKPGEVFSAYEYLNPFTVQNGYSIAGAYSQGKVIDSIGGGICQVSTTLYNAVLRAELEVVERAPHSMSVGYVKPSMDAAIAGTYKDFKFKNNLETPIYIQGYTVGRTIIFTIYGEETRDTVNRRIEFVSEVTSTTQPPKDVITEDPTKPTTYKNITQTAHIGQKAKLYKIIYENDKEVSRVLVNTSSYAAAPAYVTIGTKEEKPKDIDKKNDDKKNNNKPINEETNDDNEDVEETEEETTEEVIEDTTEGVELR